VLRESTPLPTDSTFLRIVIQPSAMAAANASTLPQPESRYTYSSDPGAEARAATLFAQRSTSVDQRPAHVDPESFYSYDAIALNAGAPPAASPPSAQMLAAQPLPQIAAPEEIYSYSPTPDMPEPFTGAAGVSTAPGPEPEARFSYDPTPAEPAYMRAAGLVVPSIPVFDGFAGLRMPGRMIRYRM